MKFLVGTHGERMIVGLEKVSMKRERMSCVVMVTFNALIYVGVLLSFR